MVAPLVGKRVMTGAVKYSRAPVGPSVFYEHLDAVERAADASQRWAQRARGGPLAFLSAAGFTEAFESAARSTWRPYWPGR